MINIHKLLSIPRSLYFNIKWFSYKRYKKQKGADCRKSCNNSKRKYKLGLNKIAARWPAKAVTQFFFS